MAMSTSTNNVTETPFGLGKEKFYAGRMTVAKTRRNVNELRVAGKAVNNCWTFSSILFSLPQINLVGKLQFI